MDSFFEKLHITQWNKLSKDSRLEALQSLERHYAQLQGRDACKFEGMKDKEHFGRYKQGKIYLNHDLLLNDNCYEAVFTVLHEGRHAFQSQTIDLSANNRLAPISDKEIYTWRVSKSGGYLKQQPDYWFQPVEKDANDYALTEMEKIYSQLEPLHGKNNGYKEYKKDLEINFMIEENKLLRTYGKNYLQTIEDKVHKKYILMQTALRHFGDKAYRLHDPAEQYVHQTYPKEILYKDFSAYLPTYLQEKGYTMLHEYLNQEENKSPNLPEFYGEFELHETILPPPLSREGKLIEKLEQAHEKLTHLWKQIDPLGGTEINQRQNEKLQDFNKKVQAEFQKQYPDVQLKPFYLSTSKTAIDIMKHNHLTGEKMDLHNGKEFGFKSSDLNKLIDQGKEMEMER
ncbi:hypothetical protein [Hazenella coriacea]|uniref:Uncharacterized protein n=1 Tax=Hazenella coriacea TaxID=1179467 RepID=A0A4R3LBC2_9BACL|nr:hypothetical protein [Hazenella coriacea]TCS94816.1 hypothetical protein EDD58_103238 [Hazenella coriacea]